MFGNQINSYGRQNFYHERENINVLLIEFLTKSCFDIEQVDTRTKKIVVEIDTKIIRYCLHIKL